MNDCTGILPEYNEPNIVMREIVGPHGEIILSLIVKDYKGFIDSLLSIKEGGQKTFIRYDSERKLTLKIVNLDGGSKSL